MIRMTVAKALDTFAAALAGAAPVPFALMEADVDVDSKQRQTCWWAPS